MKCGAHGVQGRAAALKRAASSEEIDAIRKRIILHLWYDVLGKELT
jgi:hypothetical protein